MGNIYRFTDEFQNNALLGYAAMLLECKGIDDVLSTTFEVLTSLYDIKYVSILRPRKIRSLDQAKKSIDVLLMEADSQNHGTDDESAIGEHVFFGQGVSGRAAIRRFPVVINDITRARPGEYVPAPFRPSTGSEIAIPLRRSDRTLVGVLEAQSETPNIFTKPLTALLQRYGVILNQALIGVGKKEHDERTGLLEQGVFDRLLRREINYALKSDYNLSVVMLDLDHFKAVNDTCGHEYGNEILRRFGQLLLQNGRESDHHIRYGGDEFAIIMPDTDAQNARIWIDRMQELTMTEITINHPALMQAIQSTAPVPLTFSYGLSTKYFAEKLFCAKLQGASSPHNSETVTLFVNEMMEEADTGIYKMKRSRNDESLTFDGHSE